MAARGLGKGLDSLIPNALGETKTKKETAAKSKTETTEGEEPQTLVKITKVEPNREQPRKNFDEDALQELADSIKQFGLLQPILVQDRKDYYEIIAGERRWRAAKLYFFVQFQKSDRVGNRCTALGYSLCNFILLQMKLC